MQSAKQTKTYVCELCQKVFTQKIDYTRHTKKKNACVSLDQLQEIVQTSQNTNDEKIQLINIFKACLNILRDNEALTGPIALRQITSMLSLKLLEKYFNDKIIDIDNFEYNFSDYDFNREEMQQHKNKLLSVARFSNLLIEPEENLPRILQFLWEDILSKHDVTKHIFLEKHEFKIKRHTTYKRLLNKINELPTTNNDVLGDAYEDFIKDIMTGKVFGQFFTPHAIKTLMMQLIDPQIHENGTIESCCDPTMGTAGFLIEYLKTVVKKSNEQNVQLDWNFIKTSGIYGKEIDSDTYQLAMSNMLISSGCIFEKLECGDSIRNPIMKKFDNVLANPPFVIEGLEYDDFHLDENIRNSYIPIKTKNAVSLFIQAIICMLNINGKCAIVLPNGKELFSKTNKTLIAIREYLMKTCDLKEIIYLPSGIFTYTPIKTCVFYFVKKLEASEVIEIKFKKNKKTGAETRTDYKFSILHQTTNVTFYDYNPYENVKNLLADVLIEQIANNSYSLNYTEYLECDVNDATDANDENNEEQNDDDDVIVKTLGEVCNFNIGGTPSRNNLEYYENGTNLWVSIRDMNGGYIYDTKEKITDLGVRNSSVKLFKKDTILFSFKLSIGKTAIAGIPLYTNEAIAGILSKNETILTNKYLYYYLSIKNFSKMASGLIGCGSLNKKSLAEIEIYIPSLEKQEEIVRYLDFIYEKSNKTSAEKISELKQLNEFCMNNQVKFGNNNVKTLGEICNFNIGGTPLRTITEYYENGNNLWISVRELNGGYIYDSKEKITNLGVKNSSVKLFEKDTVLFSFKLSIGKTAIVGTPLYTNEAIAGIMSKNENVLINKYLYYYLSINDFSKKTSGLIGAGSLNKQSLAEIELIIPSLDKQQEIVEYCDRNCELIKQLENEMENNKRMAKEFLHSILKTSSVTNDCESEANPENLKTCGLNSDGNDDIELLSDDESILDFDDII